MNNNNPKMDGLMVIWKPYNHIKKSFLDTWHEKGNGFLNFF